MDGNLGRQFDQPTLPGMENMKPTGTLKPAPSATPGRWSGPPQGQLVMGVHDATHGQPVSLSAAVEHKPFEIDPHGFIHEAVRAPNVMSKITPSADKAAGNPSAAGMYNKFGGSEKEYPEIRAHWDAQPLHEVKADTPIHTGQGSRSTEHEASGRSRIDSIRESLRAGDGIRDPAWLMRQSGRLYTLDGHHRIVAAREEGLKSFPARIWDRDAEARDGR